MSVSLKKNLKVALSAVFFLFLIFVVLVQTFLSNKKVKGWVDQALNQSQILSSGSSLSYEFKKVRPTLTGSFSHPFGMRIYGLKFEIDQECVSIQGRVEKAIIPISLSKAFSRKVDIGILRLIEGSLSRKKKCESGRGPKKTGELKGDSLLVASNKQRIEAKLVDVFSKVKKDMFFNSKLWKSRALIKGVLLYDFKIHVQEGLTYHAERMKTFFAEGLVKLSSQWKAYILFQESKSKLKVNFKIYDDKITSDVLIKEKEGRVEIQVEKKFKNPVEELQGKTRVVVKVEHLPLSFLGRFKKLNLAGVNLRKAWVSLNGEARFFDDKSVNDLIHLQLKKFKVYGGLGSLELTSKEIVGKWNNEKDWIQNLPANFSLQSLKLKEVLYPNAKKKAERVFENLGELNAKISMENFKKINGDFEIDHLSVLLRSLGKKAFQKIKYARGSFDILFTKSIEFEVNEMFLEKGAFEGALSLKYIPGEDEFSLFAEISHLEFDHKMINNLFRTQLGKVSIFGKAFVPKSLISRKLQSLDYGSKKWFSFDLNVDSLESKKWGFKGAEFNCLAAKEMKCKTKLKKVNFISSALKSSGLSKELLDESLLDGTFFFRKGEMSFLLGEFKEKKAFLNWTPEKGAVLRYESPAFFRKL